MSYSDKFNEALEKELKKKKKKETSTTKNDYASNFSRALEKEMGTDSHPVKYAPSVFADDDDIAPVVGDGGKKNSWFKSGGFSDGVDGVGDFFGDLGETILGTTADLGIGMVKGAGRMVEGLVDLGTYGVAKAADAFGADEFAEKAKRTARYSATDEWTKDAQNFVDQYSVLGNKADMVSEGLGQVGAIILTGGVAGAAGLSGAGVAAVTTGVTGLSSMGTNMGAAFDSGATDKDAFLYGLSTGAIEAGTELLFGGLGKGVKALGISRGIGGLDDIFAKKLASKIAGSITNEGVQKALGNTIEYAVKSSGEGLEEVLSGLGSAVMKKLTYEDDESLKKLIADENLLEQFVVGAVTSSIAQGGDFVKATKSGTDLVTGHTAADEKVVSKVVEDEIARREKAGETLSTKDKNEIYDSVVEQMEHGQIDIDTIEEVLGGDSYKAYKDTVESEDALKTELDELRKMKSSDMNDLQVERMNELKGMNLTDTTKRDGLRKALDDTLSPMLQNSKLSESYRERERRGQKFEADLSKYNGKQRAAVERAVKSGVLNNTYRSHELVDVLSKIEAEKGISFDYTNNAKLKESGFAVDGKTVNGFANKSKGTVTLNVQSHKAWQSVVGHEITHVLETNPEAYNALRESLYAYAESKGELEGRRAATTALYDGMDADIEAELTADMVGDYLFSDKDFVKHLTGNRTMFQKIYDEIKYLWNKATGKEKTEIEKVKDEFDRVWKELSVKETGAEISETDDSGDGDIDFSVSVTEKDTLDSLNEQVARGEYDPETNPDGGYYVTYKSMSFWGYDEDGNAILRSPMAEYVDGELSKAYLIPKDKNKLNWYQATETIDENTGLPSGLLVKAKQDGKKSFSYLPASENQDLIAEDWSNLYFNLRKKILKNGKWVNSDVPARYNPYEHSSNSMLNDQFTAAYQRDNLVTVKMIVPISEDNGAYRAKWSKDPTGWSDWKSGIVAGKIAKQKDLQRRVYLSRYAAPVEIVPDSEVAQAYKGYLEGTDVAIPDNVVSPNLLSELRKAGVPIEESGKVQYSINEIIDENNNSYGMGVKLDSTLLDNLTPDERIEMVKERVKELGGSTFTAYDNNGNAVDVTIAKSSRTFKNKNGRRVSVNKDLTTKYNKNETKQEAVVLVDELIETAHYLNSDPAKHPHDWLDNNGKNDWERWTTYIEDKNNTIWEATLNVANATNGEKILYDISPIKKVGRSGKSDAVPTDKMVPQNPDIVNTQMSISSDSEGTQLSDGQMEYFADSKVRDENGNLKVMYHGTPSGDFTVFRDGTYFTENKWYADLYQNPGASSINSRKAVTNPKTYKVYLDIKKPFDIADAEARDIYINEYIKGGNAVGINPYLSDAEYAKISSIDWTEGEDLREFLIDNGYDYDGLVLDEGAVGGYGDDVKYRGKSYVIFNPEQVKDVENKNPTSDPDIRNSLSNDGEEYAPVGNYSTPFRELAYGDDIAPVNRTVNKTVNTSEAPSLADIPVLPDDELEDGTYAAVRPEKKKPVASKSERIADGSRSDELLNESLDNHPVQTIEQKIAEKIRATQGEIADRKDLRREKWDDYESRIADLRAKYNAKKNKNTKEASKILQSISRLERMKASDDADFSKRISDLEARVERMSDPKYGIAMQKRAKMEADAKWAADLLGDTSTWVDKKIGLQYATNTERRNLRDIVRDENGNVDIAKADAIDDALNGQYNRDEAAKKRELANVRGKYADLGITKAEDAYIQMLGELRYNPDTTLTEQVVSEYFEKHRSKIDPAKVDKIIEMARQDYDDFLNRVNAELKKQGMKEIPYRQGYFPHFTEPKQNFIQKLLNWKVQDNEIPTSIAGLTETFKPTRSWQSFDKRRYSDETDYSFMKGFDSYSEGALDWIYHMDTLQKRRAVENHIRYTHSDEGISDRIKAVYANEDMDANEAQAQIEHILSEAKNPLNNFVQDFTTHTNILAGKKNSLDRTVEQWTNRHIYSVMTNVQNRLSANMVLANVRSAMTNFIPITQSWAQVSPLRSLQAVKQTIANSIKDDGTVDKSAFLTNRLREADKLYQTNWDKVLDKAGIMFEIVDNISSQVIWRSKYNQNLADGMTEAQAIRNADQFAENVMAGRSKGNEPTLFNAKNPFVKAFTMFQLEVNNQYGYLFKDVPNDLKAETEHWKFNLAKGYTAVFVGAYVYNALLEKVTGSDAALDPIAIVEELLRDLGLIGDDEEEEPEKIVTNLFGDVAEELPFVGGVLGGGRIPISSALPYGGEYGGGLSGFVEDVGNIGDGGLKNIGKELMKPVLNVGLPVGGNQIKKSIQGLKMFSDDHPVTGSYTDSGSLRFPVEATPLNVAQAALFGQYASKNAREYFDNDYAPMKEKQIQEYIDVDMPIKDYWEYREGLKGKTKAEDKMDYISGLDLPTYKKNILANNALDRKTPVDLENYDDFGSLEEFDYATKNPEKYALAKSVGGYSAYQKYSDALYDIKADKDANGKTINGSRKEKVLSYINNLDADYYTKILLWKSEYPSDDTYNREIVDYINGLSGLTYTDRVNALTELGFRVTADGQIYAD